MRTRMHARALAAAASLGALVLATHGAMSMGAAPANAERSARTGTAGPAALSASAAAGATAATGNTGSGGAPADSAAAQPDTYSGANSSAYVGALPFAYNPGEIKNTTNVAKLAQQYAHSPAAGISWKFKWADIETASGQYDWTPIDNAITAAQQVHLPVILRVIAGMYSPQWVLNSVSVVRIPNHAFPNPAPYPNPTVIPVPWDTRYLYDIDTFIHAFGNRYDNHPGVYLVEMNGAGVVGDMYLPPDPSAWNAAGYSDLHLVEAWQNIISTYDSSFAHTALSLAFAEPFGCTPGAGNSCSANSSASVMDPVVQWMEQTYRGHDWLQDNGLKPQYAGRTGPHRKILESARSFTGTGYQLAAQMSASALHTCFSVARQDQVRFVEVYPDDLLNPADASAFHYLRYG